MIDWLRDWWEDVSFEWLVFSAISAVILLGVWTCYQMPPHPVSDRFFTHKRVQHQECTGTDAKGNCTQWYYWDTIEPQWVLVDDEDKQCEVMESTYLEATQGMSKKCIQLFGWRGGIWDTDFPIIERGWKTR